MPLRAAELEVLYTANTAGVDQGEKKVRDSAQRIESKPVTQKVDGDAAAALADLDRVAAEAKKLVSERAVLQIDSDITRAEKQLERAQAKVEDLSIRGENGFEVTADLKRAEAALSRTEQQLDRLRKLRTNVEIDANTAKAESELDQLADKAGAAGAAAGAKGGSSLVSSLDGATRGAGEKVGDVIGSGVEDSLIAALTAIPIAGGVVLAGVAIGQAINGAIRDGLQQEVGFDRLEALTGISPASALRIGRAAGEAYANVFGDSIEANLDTARLALQFDILDPEATSAQAQKTVEGLAGIADVMREDVQPVATATATLLRTGLARSAQEAFDLIAAGEREGANRAGDWLDTLTEYPALFQRLGLSGPESLGLISQALAGGARNSDLAADALKEFQIRATDASETSAAGFEALGLNAEEMTAKIARGGQDARDGLDVVLDRLREMEDPVQRNTAAVALFGTQAEDLGNALFAMDLSNAVDQLGQVEGAAQRMFDTLADNDASKIEQAQRNIEVAMDGIKGALASGFSEPLADAAEFISQNRGPVMQFFLDLANGALDFGSSVVEGMATGTEAVGEFVAGPLADLAQGLGKFVGIFDVEAGRGLTDFAEDMRGFDEETKVAADSMRDLANGAIEDARSRLNEFGEGAVALGYLNDASLRLAESLDTVGFAADGTTQLVDAYTVAQDGSVQANSALSEQIRAAVAAMEDELAAAEAAGEGQAQLTDRYNTATGALVGQLTQMGLTEEQARALIDTIIQTPGAKTTAYSSNADSERGKIDTLATRIVTLPDGSVVITADTSRGRNAVNQFITDYNGATIRLNVATDSIYTNSLPARKGYHGGLVEFMAQGGIPDLTPMSSIASVVPANTWRVVGDRGDVAEAFIPLDGSPRSLSILEETIRRMPGVGGGARVASSGDDREAVFHLYDSSGQLMATMRGVASQIVGDASRVSGVRLSGGESSR